MVKRMCVLYPDGSVSVMSNVLGPVEAMNEARSTANGFNKGEKDKTQFALSGEIEIDLVGFREKC